MSASRYARGVSRPADMGGWAIADALGFPRDFWSERPPADELERFEFWGVDLESLTPEATAKLRATPVGATQLASPCVEAWFWLSTQPDNVAEALTEVAALDDIQSWLDGKAVPDRLQAAVLHELVGIAPDSWQTLDGEPITPA